MHRDVCKDRGYCCYLGTYTDTVGMGRGFLLFVCLGFSGGFGGGLSHFSILLQSGTGNMSEHSGCPSLGTQQLCHHTSCVQGCPKPGQHGGTAQAPFMSPSQQMANECAVEMKLSSGLEHERKRHLVFTLFGELWQQLPSQVHPTESFPCIRRNA